jgi:hypothetical protein
LVLSFDSGCFSEANSAFTSATKSSQTSTASAAVSLLFSYSAKPFLIVVLAIAFGWINIISN